MAGLGSKLPLVLWDFPSTSRRSMLVSKGFLFTLSSARLALRGETLGCGAKRGKGELSYRVYAAQLLLFSVIVSGRRLQVDVVGHKQEDARVGLFHIVSLDIKADR